MVRGACPIFVFFFQVEASESEPVAALELSDAEANVASPALGLVRLRWPILGNLFDIFVT